MMSDGRPSLYMLIGLPGTGKSTWREAFQAERIATGKTPATIISSDDAVEAMAEQRGQTYGAFFKSRDFNRHFKEIEQQMMRDFETAVAAGEDIIVDRTNMSRGARARFLDKLPPHYERTAVVFELPPDELRARLDARAARTGKVIRPDVLKRMQAGYEPPSLDEVGRVTTPDALSTPHLASPGRSPRKDNGRAPYRPVTSAYLGR